MLHNQALKSKGNKRKLSPCSYLKPCTLPLSLCRLANLVRLSVFLQSEDA